MTQQQTIEEINKIISTFPEKKLESLLYYLKQVDFTENLDQKLLSAIFKEDKNLLKRLAQ